VKTIRIGLVLCLVSALPGLGCADPVGDAEQERRSEPVGSVSSGFTNGYWWYTINGNHTVNTGLSGAQWTCFLRGVQGSLQGDYSRDFGNTNLEVRAYISTGDLWYFTVDNNGNGQALGGSVMCVPAEPIIASTYWDTGFGKEALEVDTTNSVCGISGVTGGQIYNSNHQDITWDSNGTSGGTSGDSIYMTNDGSTWYIDGSGQAAGFVSCTHASAGYWWWNYYYGNGNWNLLQDNINTVQCFMYGVGGRFRTSSYSNGAQVAYNSSTAWWSANPTGGQSVWAMCVE
jgi:hypothetical protein